jgi:microsomal dipeptidase-like Zn-dependent dipeptidase
VANRGPGRRAKVLLAVALAAAPACRQITGTSNSERGWPGGGDAAAPSGGGLPPGMGGGGSGAVVPPGADGPAMTIPPAPTDASGGPVAPLPPPPERAASRWGPARKDDCTGPGLRQISAPLRNVPAGMSNLDACRRTPRNLMGIDFPGPTRCADNGERGEWDVPDTSCGMVAPTAPPERGGEGKLMKETPLEGYADLHVHQMGHLGFGGSVVWGSAFGPPAEALSAIPEFMKRGHDMAEAFFDGTIITGLAGIATHDEGGYPSFGAWPSRDISTHQQAYEDWLFRAYVGGMRLMVMLAVNSEDMFGRGENDLPVIGNVAIQTARAAGRSTNDMEALEFQVREAYRMQEHIDAKNGGPGKGWYRIVRDPDEASDAIAKGQLAVILGTELQHLFNCDSDRAACSEATISTGLDRLEAMGVNYVFPIHHKLNQFGGATQFNPLTNGPTEECWETKEKCSSTALSPLGRHLMEQLMARGMLIDTEHMGWKTLDDVLSIAEKHQYPLMASHIGFVDTLADETQTEQLRRTDQVRRLLRLGSVLGIILGVGSDETTKAATDRPALPASCGGGDAWGNAYFYARSLAANGGLAGEGGLITVGSDWNGFSFWPPPRFANSPCATRTARDGKPIPKPAPISYPIALPEKLVPAAIGGTKSLTAMSTPRAWDYNKEGLMHAGLMPEFFEDLRRMGMTTADLESVYRSARGVVETWRTARARAVPGDQHRVRWVAQSPFDLLKFTHGDASRDVLAAPGFPICRTRITKQVGFEVAGVCHVVDGEDSRKPLTTVAAAPIVAYHAGRCLDVNGVTPRDGAKVTQWTCNGGSNQRFSLRGVEGGRYELVAAVSDKCVEVEAGAVTPGTGVAQMPCTSAAHQRFDLVRNGNTFALRASHSQLCLEVEDQARKDGAPVLQTICHGGAHQQWSIDGLLANDHERLYQADKGRIAWQAQPSGAFTVEVTTAGGRALCRTQAAPANSSILGVVVDGVCQGRPLEAPTAGAGGTPPAMVRATSFERLYQSP